MSMRIEPEFAGRKGESVVNILRFYLVRLCKRAELVKTTHAREIARYRSPHSRVNGEDPLPLQLSLCLVPVAPRSPRLDGPNPAQFFYE